ncbi:hypothetical protein C0J52_00039 [Blattella germanica]|nr:hypothetical protein C0J52_00039 [Blattella germanica]
MNSERVVILVDMDCFYCQVEARLNPTLKGKPMAVVQYNQWKGGGIIAVNYEARDFGVTRSMRGNEAKSKCPDIVLVPVSAVRGKADLSKYRNAGREVVDVLCQFSDCIQRASVDEAYIDITRTVEERMKELPRIVPAQLPNTFVVGYGDSSNDEATSHVSWMVVPDLRLKGLEEWLNVAYMQRDEDQIKLAMGGIVVEELRAAVFSQTGFRCSAGIAHNKVLSKLACGLHKPNRQTILPEPSIRGLFDNLPIKKVKNLGGKFGETLKEQFKIRVMSDLTKYSETQLQQRFDHKTGSWLYNIARGIDHEPVTPRLLSKSIGCCKKFPGRQALAKRQDVEFWLSELAAEVAERLEKDLEENKRRAKLLTVSYLQGSSCSRSGPLTSYNAQNIASDALELIRKNSSGNQDTWHPPLKYLGLSVGKFVEEASSKNSTLLSFFKTTDKPADTSCTNMATDVSVQPKQNVDTPKEDSSLKNSFFMKYLKQKAEGNSVVVPAATVSSDDDMFGESGNSNAGHIKSNKPSSSKSSSNYEVMANEKDSSAIGGASTSRTESDDSLCVSISEIFPNLDDVDDDIVEMLPEPLRERLRDRIEICGKAQQNAEKIKSTGKENKKCQRLTKERSSSTEIKKKVTDKREVEVNGHIRLSRDERNDLSTNGETAQVKAGRPKDEVGNPIELENALSSKSCLVPQMSNSNDHASEEDNEELRCWQLPQGSSESLELPVNTENALAHQHNHKDVSHTTSSNAPRNKLSISKHDISNNKNNTKTSRKCTKMPEDLDAITALEEEPSEAGVDNEGMMEVCPQCNKAVPLVEYLEHSDFHAAELLHKELNRAPLSRPPQKTEIPTKRKRGRPSRKGTPVIGSDKKMRSITAYFTPK